MPGFTPRQLLALWPVLAGSIALGLLIADIDDSFITGGERFMSVVVNER